MVQELLHAITATIVTARNLASVLNTKTLFNIFLLIKLKMNKSEFMMKSNKKVKSTLTYVFFRYVFSVKVLSWLE